MTRKAFAAGLFWVCLSGTAWAQPAGGEFRINGFTTSSQYFPSVAVDPNGDFVVAWESWGEDGSQKGAVGPIARAQENVVGERLEARVA